MINILWVRLNLVTKANSACSKEYASTSHDLFFFNLVPKFAILMLRALHKVFSEKHIACFAMNTGKENYYFFLRKVSTRKIIRTCNSAA